MTAASGVVHEEMHEKNWAKNGGVLRAIQLWVNLPQTQKMAAPGYQTILSRDIPVLDLDGGAGRLRLIAGSYQSRRGPARTFTPIELFDVMLAGGRRAELTLPEEHKASVFVLQGVATVNGSRGAGEAELIVCKRTSPHLVIDAQTDSRLLILGGKPIGEPIARYGPFVMNTKAELTQAVNDYQAGKMGHLS